MAKLYCQGGLFIYELQEDVQSGNTIGEVEAFDSGKQDIEAAIKQKKIPKKDAILHTLEVKEDFQEEIQNDVCIEVIGNTLFISEYEIKVQLLEIQRKCTDEDKKTSMIYVFLVDT